MSWTGAALLMLSNCLKLPSICFQWITLFSCWRSIALKTVAYLRVSTGSQDLANQKLAILEFSQKRRFPIDQFIESRISSRKSPLERRIDEMLGTLQPGDRPLVSELSRLGRRLSQVIQIVETLVRRKIRFIAYQSDYS